MAYNGKYGKPSGGNIYLRLAFVLMCLVIVSVYMMGGLLAKYTVTGSGEDQARVAKFDVKITGAPENMEVTAGQDPDTGVYQITVQNDSEVAVSYEISTDADAALSCTLSSNSGQLAVGDSATHSLTTAVADWAAVTKDMTGESDSATYTVTVTVKVTQID